MLQIIKKLKILLDKKQKYTMVGLMVLMAVSYTHLTLPTIRLV